MLLVLDQRAGIPAACILFSGILALLLTVSHALLGALRVTRHSPPGTSHSPYEYDLAQQGPSSGSDLTKAAGSNPSSSGREGSE
ncbi:hypothetical protein BTVI_131264 [Pitangus sulphuratus]|nr:hypothetical protein BTVI_131264 [Pitangus sulphuratus]